MQEHRQRPCRITSRLPSQQPRALRARHYRAEFVALKAADAPPPAVAFGQLVIASGRLLVEPQSVGQTTDPQTDAAIRIMTWAIHGTLQPISNDFATLRLVLLALPPQIGGMLLMVGQSETRR
jgi:hypothetical protein